MAVLFSFCLYNTKIYTIKFFKVILAGVSISIMNTFDQGLHIMYNVFEIG